MTKSNQTFFSQWLLVWGMAIGSFALALTTTCIMTAIPDMARALNLNDSEITWAVNIYMLAAASFIIFGSRIGDFFNLRRIFYFGNLLFLLGSIAVATAQNAAWLLLGRALQGLGVAFIIPNSLAIIKTTFHDPETQKIGIGIWSGIVSLGFASGPLVAGLLTNSLGWRYVFWITLPISLFSYLLCFFSKCATLPKQPIKIDYPGQLCLIISVFLIAFALNESVRWTWESSLTWIVLIAGILLFIAFYFIEKRTEHPTIDFKIFKNKAFASLYILLFLTFYLLISILFIYNIFAQSTVTLGYDAMQTGVSLLPTTLAIFILSFITPKLGNKIGFRYPATISFLCMTIGFLWFFFIKTDVSYADLWVPLMLIGLGLGGTFPCFSGLALSKLPHEQAGLGSGLVGMNMYVTAIFSTAIGSMIYTGISTHETILRLKTLASLSANQLSQLIHQISAGKRFDFILQQVPAQDHAFIISAAKIASIHAFNIAMLVAAILAFIGCLLSWCTIKE